MNKESHAKYTARAEIIKAMAHATRLMIMDELAKGEHCVCELTEMAGADVSTVSKHISILKNVGIVEVEKRSQKVFCKLKTPCVMNFIECVEKVMKSRLKNQLSLVE